jgi:hypothetical protein
MKKIYFLLVLLGLTFGTSYAQTTSIALVGEAAGGWPNDPGNPGPTDVHQLTSTDGGIVWTLASVTLTTAQAGGGVKFRSNNSWTATNWGAAAFPSGTATTGGANINCTAGTFSVTFNTATLAYVFTPIASVFPTVAIVGSATAQGWPNETQVQVDAAQLSTSDGVTYKSNMVALVAGELKFRQNNSFDVSWGGTTFPSGPQSGNSDNIIVTVPGNYRVVFNRTTGSYTFDFPSIAIVGEAVGGWPGSPGTTDTHQLTTTNGGIYMINNLVVTAAISGGGAKFRQDNAWDTSWGNDAFPSANSSNGNNILTVAGIYNVQFTRSTGAYEFAPALSSTNFTKSGSIVYPNPTNSSWNFSTNNGLIKSVVIIDISGKVICTTTATSVDASSYSSGIYFAQIQTESAVQIIKLVKK